MTSTSRARTARHRRRVLARAALASVVLPALPVLTPSVAFAHEEPLSAGMVRLSSDCDHAAVDERHHHSQVGSIAGAADGQEVEASANSLQLQAAASGTTRVLPGSTDGDTCRVNGGFDDLVRVHAAPGSGLQVGAPVTLVAEVFLGGGVQWKGNDAPVDGQTSGHLTTAEIDAGFTAVERGGARVARFTTSVDRTIDAFRNAFGASSYEYRWNTDWDAESNTDHSTGQSDGTGRSMKSFCATWPCPPGGQVADPGATGRLMLPMTAHRMEFTTTVGAVIDLSADVSTYTYAGRGPGEAHADAAIDVDVESLTAGVRLSRSDEEGASGPDEDLTAPVVTATVPDAGADGWHTADVPVVLAATDDTGVSSVEWRRQGEPEWSGSEGATATVPVTADGTTVLEYRAHDTAGNTSEPQSVTVRVDRTAPTATAQAPTTPVPSATVALSATDATSGVQSLVWSVDGGAEQTAAGATASVPLAGDGTRTVRFAAVDVAGNRSPEQSAVVTLDSTAPVLVLPAPVSVTAAPGAATATVTFAPSATDGGATLPVTCDPASGSAFPVGTTTTVTCSATDAAGNTASGSFAVTVVAAPVVQTPAQRVAALTTAVAALPETGGVRAPLTAQLTNARTALAAGKHMNACSHLAQFAHMTEQRSGKKIAPEVAAALVAEARAVRGLIGC